MARGFRALLDQRMRFIMLIAFGLAFFQQITGINAIFYYLPTIFAQAGGNVDSAFRQPVLVGLVNVGMTIVAIWLIDRLGRKPLLTAGVAGMAVSLLTIAWAFGQASYQLSENAYETAKSNGAPAELVADLRSFGDTSYSSETEFVAALKESTALRASSRIGRLWSVQRSRPMHAWCCSPSSASLPRSRSRSGRSCGSCCPRYFRTSTAAQRSPWSASGIRW